VKMDEVKASLLIMVGALTTSLITKAISVPTFLHLLGNDEPLRSN
jgi:hypothetical protein